MSNSIYSMADICAKMIWNERKARAWSCSSRRKIAQEATRRGRELEPRPGDAVAVLAWKQRMADEEGKEVYRQRAATSETVNADLRRHRGLTQFTVRGLAKVKCVALWCALAYNIMHFGAALLP